MTCQREKRACFELGADWPLDNSEQKEMTLGGHLEAQTCVRNVTAEEIYKLANRQHQHFKGEVTNTPEETAKRNLTFQRGNLSRVLDTLCSHALRPDVQVLVASTVLLGCFNKDGTDMIGFLAGSFYKKEKVAFLHYLCSATKGTRCGTKLLAEFESRASAESLHKIYADVLLTSEEFYKKMLFERENVDHSVWSVNRDGMPVPKVLPHERTPEMRRALNMGPGPQKIIPMSKTVGGLKGNKSYMCPSEVVP
jgi:hypothetical protein